MERSDIHRSAIYDGHDGFRYGFQYFTLQRAGDDGLKDAEVGVHT